MSDAVPVITDDAALAAFVDKLAAAPWVAMDTEFMRERNYFPQLCLIQIASADQLACIDPLAGVDLSLLKPLLVAPQTTKVFHAAFQDMEVLLHSCGVVPAPVFDTQVAATLVGLPDQMGYARLVQDLLGVELEKSHSRTDWARRPLDTAELEYAADDVRYLARLYPQLRDDLAARGRLDWLRGEFEDMSDPGRYITQPEQAWQRVKAWKRLKPAQLGVLQALAAWREQQARDADRPRGWILKDDVLADIARRRPGNIPALAKIRGMPEATVKRHGEVLLKAVETGRQRPLEIDQPVAQRLSARQQALTDLLSAGLRLRALEADISPSALANRSDLEKLVLGENDTPLLQGWRRQAAGDFLLGLLAGEQQLQVSKGRVKLVDSSPD